MKRFLKLVPALVVATGLGACASQDNSPPASTQDVSQAVRDFIDVRGLESIDSVKVSSTDGMKKISGEFVLYKGRQANYIMEFVRQCDELDDYRIVTPDKRWDLKSLHARYDTIRGCRIASIYALSEVELSELLNIGDVPGEHS
jgi:hypothetical protein